WVATSSGGAGGGVAFYLNLDKQEINIANYDSIDVEFDYSVVEGKWNETAMNTGFAMRILPWDSTGLFGGYEELEYFASDALSGTLTHKIVIPSDFANRIIATSDYDSVLGFALKFDDYQRGNSDGDQLKVKLKLKNVTFHAKDGAAEDIAFDDGLKDSQRGTVVEMNYPSRDYTVAESDLTDADRYVKHAWVYLPAGYDASDINTKYPLFILLHGGGQNENSWGLTNKGRGGKIKGYMDRGMANGSVENFVLVAATGVANKSWGPNGRGSDLNGFDAFEGELRNDLLPYIRAHFNIKEGRDYVALAGLSRGGGQTLDIGIQQCLDLISNYATFSVPKSDESEFIATLDAKSKFDGLKIHNFYINCGTEDPLCKDYYPAFVEDLKQWDRIENFKNYTFIGGTHDFPVWYKGFYDFIQMIF
ncbi:carbohydrate esterase family 1 protein, partial [Piromyces sp. E2]